MAPSASRMYDAVLLGATGYTGKLCAEHIITTFPTSFKWAVAGRSESKLHDVVDDLKLLDPDRAQPGIEVTTLALSELERLAKKTRLLINTVGPYHLYSGPVVEACAKNGTHYLDVTGESPWVLEMIRKYDDIAKQNHAIIVPAIGIESAPSDLLAWALVDLIRQKYSTGVKDVTACVHELKGAPSGGTLLTALGILDHYSVKELAEASGKWKTSPVPHTKMGNSPSLASRLLGVRNVPGLGVLTTSITAAPNTAVVQRSWGIFDGGQMYGSEFQYQEYMAVRNSLVGFAIHALLVTCSLALLLPPIRWLAKKAVTAPGQGPTKEASSKESIEFRAIAVADQPVQTQKRAFGRLRWDGGMYYLTGVFLAEAAMVILQGQDLVKRLGGGLLTPAVLGQRFIDRLKAAGVVIEIGLLDD